MAQYDVDLREYWRILKKRKVTVIITVIALGAFSTFFAIFKAPTPLYNSICSIKFEKEQAVEGLYARTLSWSGSDDIESLISVLKSHSIIQKVAEKLGKIPKGSSTDSSVLKPKIAAIVHSLQQKVKVTREQFTNIINIEVTDTTPAFAQRLAHTIAVTYKEQHAEAQNRRTVEAMKYIAQQLKETLHKLRESEDEFNRFTQENQLVSIDLQSESLLLHAKEVRGKIRQFEEANREINELLLKLDQFINDPSGSGGNLYSTYANKQYQDIHNVLVGLLLKRDSLLEDYTARHPEVIDIRRRIIENARKMEIIARSQINDLEKRKKDSEEDLAKVNKKTGELMEKKLEFNRLKRKVDSYNDMTALLERKNQEALIRKAEKPDEITIVRPALLPTFPINPPKTVATGAMGVVVGLILGIVIAFIVETFDTSLGAIEDVEETLGTQVLGVIPQGDMKGILESLEGRDQEGDHEDTFRQEMALVSHFVPQSMLAESFRALRTNIQFRDLEKNVKTIAITSASPQEGKTSAAVNLAITMAQSGMKTLLIESDLRKPAVAKVFGIESSPGLTDVLLGNYSWRDVVKTITDLIIGKMDLTEVMITPGLDNLNIITSGTIPPNPSELIDSNRVVDFIEEIKEDYDMVIFDTPPILSTADPMILGAKVDAVVLVYRIGSVSKGLLKRATLQMSQAKGNLMGVVLNGMKAEVSPDFQDFKYYKYYYSYGQEGKEKKKKRVIKKKGDFLRLLIALIALGLLVLGLLWQKGLLPVEKYLFKKPAVSRERTKIVSQKIPTQSAKMRVAESVPVKEAQIITPGTASTSKQDNGAVLFKKPRQRAKIPASLFSPEKEDISPPEQKADKMKTDGPPTLTLKTISPTRQQDPETDMVFAHAVDRYPYSIQMGAYETIKEVKKAVAFIEKHGLFPYWNLVDLERKGKWYRVFVGAFSTVDGAKKFIQKYGFSNTRVLKTAYAVQVEGYPGNRELTQKLFMVEKTGYSPYTIKEFRETMTSVTEESSLEKKGGLSGKTAIINVSAGNIRLRPTKKSSIIDKLARGEKVTLIEKRDEWDIVGLQDGRVGWAHQRLFLEKDFSPNKIFSQLFAVAEDTATIRVNIGRVREKPSAGSRIISLLKKGDPVSVIAAKGDWFIVELEDGKLGWAHKILFMDKSNISKSKKTNASPVGVPLPVLKDGSIVEDFQKGNRILIGAFVTQKAATNLARRLKETGIDCRVVLR